MDFQRGAVEQGRTYEDAVIDNLTRFGWHVLEERWREPNTQIEVDIVAADRDGQLWWIECKGSWRSVSGRNGLARTDSTKKLIANAALLALVEDRKPYMVVTSDLPEGAGARWLNMAIDQGWINAVKVLTVL